MKASINRLSSALIFSVLAGINGNALAREMYFTCSLIGPEGARSHYSFSLDSDNSTLFWVEGTQKFEIIRNTTTQLWGSHKTKFHEFPHDETDFRLNRVTGEAEINYLRKPSAADVTSCKNARNWGCEAFLVLTEKSERGACQVVDRAIR